MHVDFLENAGWDGEHLIRLSRGTRADFDVLEQAFRDLADARRDDVAIHQLPGFAADAGLEVFAMRAPPGDTKPDAIGDTVYFCGPPEAWLESADFVAAVADGCSGFQWIARNRSMSMLLSWNGQW